MMTGETPNATNSDSARWLFKLFAPMDIAVLAYFRIIFGLMMLYEVVAYFRHGWIFNDFIEQDFYFKFYGFEWVHAWPGNGMYIHFFVVGVLAILISLGLFYRIVMPLFFLAFTHLFLIDQTNFLNHFYLICVVSFLMIFVPAHRAYSLDVLRSPGLRRETTAKWTIWLIRFQLGIAYFYGGIAKLNSDWLQGAPMREWLASKTDFPVIGPWFTEEWVVYLFSYGGLVFDLSVIPLILFKRTRWIAVAWMFAFHLLNSQLFSISVFPWLMLLATPVFFPPSWSRKLLQWFGSKKNSEERIAEQPGTSAGKKRLVVLALSMHVLFQLLIPLRHFTYPGQVNWTEEGHRFAWHMMLRQKYGDAVFVVVTDPFWNQKKLVYPREYLTPRQQINMAFQPDMILQFAHFLAEEQRQAGNPNVEVYAVVEASLNSRPQQKLIDPSVDLAKVERNLQHSQWIIRLEHPLPDAATQRSRGLKMAKSKSEEQILDSEP